jgi:hypothetical protein
MDEPAPCDSDAEASEEDYGEVAALEDALADLLDDLVVDDLDDDAPRSSAPATWSRPRVNVLEEAVRVSREAADTWSTGTWAPCRSLEAPFDRLLTVRAPLPDSLRR